MITIATIQKALYDWATLITTGRVIWAEQNSPQPVSPYFTLRLSSFRQVGEDFITSPNAAGKAVVFGNRDFTLGVQGYGSDVIQNLIKLSTSLNRPTIQDSLRVAGIVVWDRTEVSNITGLDDTLYEERGTFDVQLRISDSVDDTIYTIDKVSGTGTYKNANKETVVTEPFSIIIP